MKIRSKETYWLLKNGLMTSYPSLQKDISCDVLIIGGGITGALQAYQLSKEGYRTVVVDKRDIAMGSTSATTAMIQYEIDEPLYSLVKKVGEEAAVDSYVAGVVAIDKLERIVKDIRADCGFERKKSLFVASSVEDRIWLRKEYHYRKKIKLDVTWLSAAQLKIRFGIIGRGAILSRAGASLDAYNLTHALLRYSVEHFGLQVFDHTEVASTQHSRNVHTAITVEKNSIRCKYLIYATGYETQSMLDRKIVKLISTYAFVSEPLRQIPAALRNTIVWNTEVPYLYFRCTPDNRVLVGGADVGFRDAERRDRLLERKENNLLRSMVRLVPSLKLIPDFNWAGTFGVTRDSLPYIGAHPDFPSTYFVLGFGGNGITFSVVGMDILSDLLAGKSNRFSTYYKFDR